MSKDSTLNKTKSTEHRLGIALGGGGALGGIYEIGALRALEEALEGLDLNDLDVYVGVNAGAFVAANLANQMTSAQMCRIFVKNEADVHPFHPEVFYRPAMREYFNRAMHVPKLLLGAMSNFVGNPQDQNMLEALTVLAQAVPSGLFENEGFNKYLSRSYSSIGRTNNFRELRKELIIIAAELESGATVRFGVGDHKDVPISKAVQASMAAPGIYTPVEIGGKHYMDGTLRKGMHTSVAIEHGATTVLAVNPIVPIDVQQAEANGSMLPGSLVNDGMPNVLSQTFRTMVHSRLAAGLRAIEKDYPYANVILFEPTRNDAKLFFSNVFSFKARRLICEHAYQMMREDLRGRIDELNTALKPFDIRVREDVLEDRTRTFSTSLYGLGMMTMGEEGVSPLLSLKRLSNRISNLI